MARFLKNKKASIGQAPGEVIFIGEHKIEQTVISIIDFDSENLVEQNLTSIHESTPYKETETVSWINICGLHDTGLIKTIGKEFGIHSLVLEDIVDTGQRPKMEDYDDYLFFAVKMLRFNETTGKIFSEQLSIVLGKSFLITFQEGSNDIFEPVRNRIRKKRGRIRISGVDYLAYALLDTIVDSDTYIIERMGDLIEENEAEVLDNPSQEVFAEINAYKREMNYLRKTIRPVKELVLRLSKTDSSLISSETKPFIKDLLDLITQEVEVIDSYREMLSDHLNIYNGAVSNRMNEIMKVLTIFSAIFIPLTFVAGIYGTNFEYLPELHFKYSYFVFWCVLLVVAFFMVRFFKRKKWL